MKIIADKSIDYGIIAGLRNIGAEVYPIIDNNPGIPDSEVLEISIRESCLLITEDKDFGELTYRLR